jgi:hypothetical protein
MEIPVRMSLMCGALLLAMSVLPDVAKAEPADPVNECQANVEHIAFNGKVPTLQLAFFDGLLECVDLVIDDVKFSFGPLSILMYDDPAQTMLSDDMVLFNANNGPSGGIAANICLASEDSTGGVCDPLPTEVKDSASPNGSEALSIGPITDGGAGPWSVKFLSGKAIFPAGCPAVASDCGILAPVPEPAPLGDWAAAILIFAFAGAVSRVRLQEASLSRDQRSR